ASLTDDNKLTYQRAWLDARTYLQITPAGRLNLRLAGGGKVGSDALPNQDRVSLGFPDPLPGYLFRQMSCGGAAIAGTPALCDRAPRRIQPRRRRREGAGRRGRREAVAASRDRAPPRQRGRDRPARGTRPQPHVGPGLRGVAAQRVPGPLHLPARAVARRGDL